MKRKDEDFAGGGVEPKQLCHIYFDRMHFALCVAARAGAAVATGQRHTKFHKYFL